MAIEAFNRAQQVFRKLQSCEDFEHVGQNSRGIRIQTGSLVKGIAMLAVTRPQYAQPLILIGALIELVSEDYGTYVRVKGGPSWIGIDIRGLVGPMNEDTTLEQLSKIVMRRSGVNIDVYSDGRSGIGVHSDFLEIDGRSVASIINSGLKILPERERDELTHEFVNVVAQEVAQSGEFLDL